MITTTEPRESEEERERERESVRGVTAVLIKTMTNYPRKEPDRQTHRQGERKRFRGEPVRIYYRRQKLGCVNFARKPLSGNTQPTLTCLYRRM